MIAQVPSGDQLQKLVRENPIRLCSIDELPLGLGRAFAIEGRAIAVFKTRGGKIFAVDNRCPHKAGPLAEGMLAGDAVVCPLHAFRFDMASGECDQPGICALRTYPIEVRGSEVYLLALDEPR